MIRSRVVTVENFSDRTFDGAEIQDRVRSFEMEGFQLGQIVATRYCVLLHFTKDDGVATE